MSDAPKADGITLSSQANRVLALSSPEAKMDASREAILAWRRGDISTIGDQPPLRRPTLPDRPVLCEPRDMPRRGHAGSPRNRIALIHAIAHIEFNAINLAWDIIVRFTGLELPRNFYDDWVGVAAEETEHFAAMQQRLHELGSYYGALPAHDGLWDAADKTRHDLLARLAIVPLVLEARGLDVTPSMIERLRGAGDHETADLLAVQYDDEIEHVATGHRWFQYVCAAHQLDPLATFQHRLSAHGIDRLKPPFNERAREAAGLSPEYYLPLATG